LPQARACRNTPVVSSEAQAHEVPGNEVRAQAQQDHTAPIPEPNALLRRFLNTGLGHRALSLITGYFHATLEGAENIPKQGGALIVGNHALFAIDTAVLAALIIRDVKRNPRFLGDRNLWKVPMLGPTITAIGALPGEPQSAEILLRRGELVMVYPGGVDDSLKSNAQRYQLQWKKRAGFARVAIRAQVPIIPVVGLGIDEMYSVVARERFIGRRLLGSERYDLPVAFGAFGTVLPKRVAQRYLALPPISTTGMSDSPENVEQIRAQTYEALDAWLRTERKYVESK
jgi:1-acyl-sn-glycerol-3-phosphate acyltransferase